MPYRPGIFYDENTVHTFVLTVSAGHAILLDYDNLREMPIAEARADTNDNAVQALFDKITIPDEGEE